MFTPLIRKEPISRFIALARDGNLVGRLPTTFVTLSSPVRPFTDSQKNASKNMALFVTGGLI